MSARLLEDVRALVGRAADLYRSRPPEERLRRTAGRLDEPLRVAIAGKVKAGKSTLLNALVGEQLAPTDEGECTRIVTWYRDGHTYEVRAETVSGESHQLRFHRDRGAIEVDLGGLAAGDVDRLVVTWPSATLRRVTLVDTPGVGSLTESLAQRMRRFVDADEESAPADAVIYLMRHLHADDVAFLDAFHDTEVSRPSPVNAIAVLSRADEIGVGRLDSMGSARRIADRYRSEPKLRRLVQTVVPVAGLLAESAATLTETEFGWLRSLGSLAPADLDGLLVSADRFVATPGVVDLTDLERRHLLDRFGVFGVRLAATLLRRRDDMTAPELASELKQRSGVGEVRDLLTTLFSDRADLLKARSALLAVGDIVRDNPIPESEGLAAEAERIIAGAHELNELRVLSAIRAGWIEGRNDVLADLERLLGGSGGSAAVRVGLPASSGAEEVRAEALSLLGSWRRRAENPLTSHSLGQAAQIACRTCEGIASG